MEIEYHMCFLTLTDFIKTLLRAVTLMFLCRLLMTACTDILSALCRRAQKGRLRKTSERCRTFELLSASEKDKLRMVKTMLLRRTEMSAAFGLDD